MSPLILAAILALCVIRSQPSYVSSNQGSCPDVQTDSVAGVEGRWYMMYANVRIPTVKCTYGDILNIGNGTFLSKVVVDLYNGTSLNITSTIKKDSDGKYYDTYVNSEGKVRHDLTMMKIEDDYLLSWLCIHYEHGRIFEHASIHSKTLEKRDNSNDIVLKFDKILKERNSAAGQFYEVDDCSAK
uniref:Venom protein n=1 Tax=Hemiscolopendra marginata TaxID=943146 RepID=A0A646QGT0_9MYRI